MTKELERAREVTHEDWQPHENLENRFVAISDRVQIFDRAVGGFQAILNRRSWKARVMFASAEALLFRRREDHAIAQECGGRVMDEAVDPEDVHTG